MRQTGFEARRIELDGVVNSFMPHHVVNGVAFALNNNEFDLSVIITNDSQIDYRKLFGLFPLIVDMRNV